MCGINVTVNAGSVYEADGSRGATHTLQNLAFTETAHRSHLRLVRELETMGGNAQALASREYLTYEIEVPKTMFAEASEVLLDTVINPSLSLSGLKRAANRCAADLSRMGEADAFMDRQMHALAFQGGLATPLYGSTLNPERDGEAVAAFHALTHTGPGVVIAAAGVPHRAFLHVVEPMASTLPVVADQVAYAPSTYRGGLAVMDTSAERAVALAFEGTGGISDLPRDVARHVLTKLMGGGGSFSTGGPGKGMHSRLYQRVLCQDGRVSDCSFFHESYANTALAGIRVAGDLDTGVLLDIACREMEAVAGSVTGEEVERAKAVMEGNLCMVLENAVHVADDMAKTVAAYGKRVETQVFIDAIRKVSVADIKAEAAALLKTKPTVAVIGQGDFPSYDAVVRRFA